MAQFVFDKDVGISLYAYGNSVQEVKLYRNCSSMRGTVSIVFIVPKII